MNDFQKTLKQVKYFGSLNSQTYSVVLLKKKKLQVEGEKI